MPSRPVHWYEGMFLRPHHFQAADRHARESLRESEDWYHPFNWGIRSIEFDRDAIANYSMVLRSCEVRFKDGTKLTVPDDVSLHSVELKEALSGREPITVFLAVPTLQIGRANVEDRPTEKGPRYWVDSLDREDENTGSGEQPIQIRRTSARLLLSNQDATGYEVLPLARLERMAQVDAPPQVDPSYVPPLLALDAWPSLWRAVQSLHHFITARIEQLAVQVLDRGISFDSQVPGDAERLLKLATLNGVTSFFDSFIALRGLSPVYVYQELCRVVGQLAIFLEQRRPPKDLPTYEHENIGYCYYTAMKYIQEGLNAIVPSAFEKRYFDRLGERLQVSMEPGWLTPAKSLFLGVETELADQECQVLLGSMDMKLGSGAQVEHIFRRALRGLNLVPRTRPPRTLPASQGIVYYEVERDPIFWKDVTDSYTLALRMNLSHAQFASDRTLSVARPGSKTTTILQFALFVVDKT